MPALADWLTEHLVLAVLVLTRLSTLLMAMPAVAVGVPRRVRAMLAMLLTGLILPPIADGSSGADLPPIDHLVDLAIAIGREALIGMLIGATIQLIVTGLQLAGEAISSTGGMQLGDAVDPTTSTSMPTLARLVGLLVTAVMLIVGGHRILLSALIDSFQALPAGRVTFHDTMMRLVIDQLSTGMEVGIRVAAPVIGVLLLSNLVTGLVSRTLPQINVLAIGLSINALAMLFVSAITIGAAGLIFQEQLVIVADRLAAIW